MIMHTLYCVLSPLECVADNWPYIAATVLLIAGAVLIVKRIRRKG